MEEANKAVRVIASMALGLLTATCSDSVSVPSEVGTIDQLASALRAKEFVVSLGGESSPQVNRYFTVSSRDVIVGDERLKAFEYPTTDAADADAALVNADGQLNPKAQIGWIAAPHFFKHGKLIVLYLGCAHRMLDTLEELMGAAIVDGPGCG